MENLKSQFDLSIAGSSASPWVNMFLWYDCWLLGTRSYMAARDSRVGLP